MRSLTICGVLLFAYLQITVGDLPDYYITGSDRECLREMHLEKQIIKDAFGENFILAEGNSVINEFVVCTWKKTSYITQDGKLNFKGLQDWVKRDFFRLFERDDIENQDEVAAEVVSDCKEVDGIDIGDTAVKVYNCLINRILSYESA